MTQEELAHRIGYKSKSSINKIELDIQQLKQAKIKEIADALRTTPDYVMGWEEEVNEEPKPSLTFTDEELRILNAYRSASDETDPAVNKYLGVTLEEIELVEAWRHADEQTKRIVAYALKLLGGQK